jgi:acetyl esterase/lipase/uncharacterized glyoxalase superfamily protein PhnB
MKTKLIVLTSILILYQCQVFSNGSADSVMHVSKVYKTIDAIGLKVDIFYKQASLRNANNSAIAFFHGGALVCGNRHDFYATSRRYASKGMIAFSFQYRFADRKKLTPIECIMDAKSAIRWIRKNAKDYNIDVNKIIASGQSAGGYLANCTAMIDMYDEPNEDLTVSSKPNAIVVFSGGFNASADDWTDSLLIYRKSEKLNVDPYHHIKSGLPPVLAIAGTEDQIVPIWTTEQFLYKTRKAGNRMDLIRLDGKGHFFDEKCKEHAGMYNDSIFTYVDDFLIKNKLMPTGQVLNTEKTHNDIPKDSTILTQPDIEELSPNIFVKDVQKTIEFYQVLGFGVNYAATDKDKNPVFAIMTCGVTSMRFQAYSTIGNAYPTVSRQDGGSLMIYIRVIGIKAYYERIKNKVTVLEELEKKFYGATEFSIKDNNNYMLTFAEF